MILKGHRHTGMKGTHPTWHSIIDDRFMTGSLWSLIIPGQYDPLCTAKKQGFGHCWSDTTNTPQPSQQVARGSSSLSVTVPAASLDPRGCPDSTTPLPKINMTMPKKTEMKMYLLLKKNGVWDPLSFGIRLYLSRVWSLTGALKDPTNLNIRSLKIYLSLEM